MTEELRRSVKSYGSARRRKYPTIFTTPHCHFVYRGTLVYISTNWPRRQSCPPFAGSQSAARIYENTPLWLAEAESGTRLMSRSIRRYFIGSLHFWNLSRDNVNFRYTFYWHIDLFVANQKGLKRISSIIRSFEVGISGVKFGLFGAK